MQDLGTLPGTNFDMADTVNDSGQVVGMAGMAGEGDVTTLMAVLWTPFLLRAPPDIRTKMVR
jgi:hypothetical protein